MDSFISCSINRYGFVQCILMVLKVREKMVNRKMKESVSGDWSLEFEIEMLQLELESTSIEPSEKKWKYLEIPLDLIGRDFDGVRKR